MSYFNFNGLPHELKTRIFHIAHLADERFKERHSSIELSLTPRVPDPPGSNLDRLREYHGRSVIALSLVNKECRLLSGKWLFRYAEMEKMNEVLFQHHIFGSKSTGDWITTISFEETRNLTTANLTFAIFFILPHLPRLDRIDNLKSRTTQLLFGGNGLATIHRGARLSTEAQDQRLALRKFLHIATRIKHWSVELVAEEVEVIVLNSPNSILSLALLSPPLSAYSILETPKKRFPSILQRCTSLETSLGPVVDSVLTTSFPFAATLRSLSLDLERYGERTTSNELEFPTLFPFLEVLKITLRSNDLDQIRTKSFILPRLLDLEVMHCPFSHMHVLIESLLLPNIRTIQLESVDTSDFGVTQDEVLDEIRKLEIELGASASTLRLLHLIFDIHVPQECITLLKDIKIDAAIFVNSKLINNSKTTNIRPRVARQSFYSDFDSDYDNECGLLDYDEPLEGKVEKDGVDEVSDPTEALLNWASERITRCRDVDGAGSKEIRRVLDPVNYLRKWMTD